MQKRGESLPVCTPRVAIGRTAPTGYLERRWSLTHGQPGEPEDDPDRT